MALDEITLADPRKAEQIIYKLASGTKGPRATSAGKLRETQHGNVLVLSTGEKSLPQFIGKELKEGARKRMVDVPAEVQSSSAYETIPHAQIAIVSPRLFNAMRCQHGAVGQAWQRHLVEIGPDKIEADLDRHRAAFLALPEVAAVAVKAHPQVRAVVGRFALYGASLRMAIEASLLPWTIEEVDVSIIACMQRWAKQRGNVDTAGEIARAADRIEAAIIAELNDRFICICKTSKGWAPATEADQIKKPWLFDGYVKPDGCVLVPPEAWRRRCEGFDPAKIARHLQQRGVLIAAVGGKLSRSERVKGKAQRFYTLKLPTQPQHRNTATPDS